MEESIGFSGLFFEVFAEVDGELDVEVRDFRGGVFPEGEEDEGDSGALASHFAPRANEFFAEIVRLGFLVYGFCPVKEEVSGGFCEW